MDPGVKPIFNPDLTNNSNDSLYSGIEEEEPGGGDTEKFTGMVTSIKNNSGLMVYVPLERCHRLFVPQNYIGNVEVHLGDWICTKAQKRRQREEDLGHQPRFSHIAIGDITLTPINKLIPNWRQRFNGGIFEFLVQVEISPNFEFPVYEKKYLVPATVPLKMLIPCHRLDTIWQVGTTTQRVFEFWVTIASYVKMSRFEGVSLHLLDCNPIDEIFSDGTRIHLGTAKIIQSPDGDGCETELPPSTYESEEQPSPSLSGLSLSQNDVCPTADNDVKSGCCNSGSDIQPETDAENFIRTYRTVLSIPAVRAALKSLRANK